MYGSIVEEMALVGKDLDVNTALRAACGAAKMLALSEGVECPYTIPDYREKQCPGYSKKELDDMQQENGRAQYSRGLAFLKYVQQGVIPSIHLAALPDDEEKLFYKQAGESLNKYEQADTTIYPNAQDWIMEDLLHLPKNKVKMVEQAFRNFLKGGEDEKSGYPLIIYDCKQKGYPFEIAFSRFIGYFNKPDELMYMIEKFDRQSFNSVFAVEEIAREGALPPNAKDNAEEDKKRGRVAGAPNDINNISIILIQQKYAYDEKGAPIEKMSVQRFKEGYIKPVGFTHLLFIMTTDIIKYGTITSPGEEVIYGEHIIKSTLLKHLFERNAVIDIHPWLMYLLSKDSTFMETAFGGNMTPQQYPLAFYIVAHFVANQPLYLKNPADFYQKPIADKKKEMLAALKTNKTELTQLIADGYTWLGEPNPGIGKLLTSFGGGILNVSGHRFASVAGKAGAAIRGIFTRSKAKPGTGQGQAGGKRVTRKVRILPVNG